VIDGLVPWFRRSCPVARAASGAWSWTCEGSALCGVRLARSHDRAFATAFALPLAPDEHSRINWSVAVHGGEPRVSIHAGSLDFSRVGYLYRVSSKHFRRLDQLQWASRMPVRPLDHEVIDPQRYQHWVVKSGSPPTHDSPLWKHVASEFKGPSRSIHGIHHWQRVERFGAQIAAASGADESVVRLFALFHDSRRVNDGADPGHGARGAAYASKLRGQMFDLPDGAFALLREACIGHSEGRTHDDPTIGACWDADRLDLPRVGVLPDPRFMSTRAGREMAAAIRRRGE
jgi:uncharacterized protein